MYLQRLVFCFFEFLDFGKGPNFGMWTFGSGSKLWIFVFFADFGGEILDGVAVRSNL